MDEAENQAETKRRKCPPCWKTIVRYRKLAMIFVAPLALLPLILVLRTNQAKTAYIIIMMACYWNFEVLPLGVTALIPVVLVPALGIVPSRDLTPSYFRDSNMLFLGGLIIAASIELWNLHRRLALKVLIMCGVQPRWLLFGFLVPTWTLSMWISNTATTSMVIPIADAMIIELRRHYEARNRRRDAETASNLAFMTSASTDVLTSQDPPKTTTPDVSVQDLTFDLSPPPPPSHEGVELEQQKSMEEIKSKSSKHDEESAGDIYDQEMQAQSDDQLRASMKAFLADKRNSEFRQISRMLILSVSYGAIFGGVATLTGTSPNGILYGIVNEYFGSQTTLSYSSWLFFALPIAILTLFLAWVWLQISFLGCRGLVHPKTLPKKDQARIKEKLRKEYAKLGPISYAEINVVIIFVILIALWISREPGVPGWGQIFNGKDPKATSKTISYIGDAQPSILAAIAMFLLPSRNPFSRFKCGKRQRGVTPAIVRPASRMPSRLMSWKYMTERIPWQIVFMLGAGFALADTSKQSGLSDWVGSQLLALNVIPLEGLIFIVCFFTSLMTMLTSNTATATIVLPILASFSQKIKINPLYFMVACTASSSFGFILPISTPANILVFSRGYLRAIDMVRTGIVMWVISNVIIAVLVIWYAPVIFQLRGFPTWAMPYNSTAG